MIVFINPRATRPKNRRFPLSLMAIGAALPEGTEWEIVDGNRPDLDVPAAVARIVQERAGGADPVELIAVTVMPVTLRVSFADGTTRDVRLPAETWIRQASTDVPIVGNSSVVGAVLDPDHKIPDKDRANNAFGQH